MLYNKPLFLTLTLLTLLLLLISLSTTTNALFVRLQNGKPQCFMEDLNEKTQVIVGYKFPALRYQQQQSGSVSGVSLKVEISDPFGNVIISKDLNHQWDAVVPFKSLAEVSGVYEICFQAHVPSSILSKNEDEFSKLIVKIDIDDDAIHYEKLESKDRLENINGLLEKLKDKISYVQSDQSYIKAREERFRETSECVERRVWYFGFLMFVVLIACGTWQVLHLKSFFKQKKLA